MLRRLPTRLARTTARRLLHGSLDALSYLWNRAVGAQAKIILRTNYKVIGRPAFSKKLV